MSRQTDTRIRIVDSLKVLLKARSFESIKVSDLCKAAGISRTTFYVYFDDIHAVVQWFWDDLCSRSLYLINDSITWHEGHIMMLRGLLAEKAFFQRAFEKKDYQSLFSYGYRKSLIIHIANLEKRLNRSLTEDEVFELDYTVRSLSVMTTKWAEEGMDVPPERLAILFDRFLPEFARCL